MDQQNQKNQQNQPQVQNPQQEANQPVENKNQNLPQEQNPQNDQVDSTTQQTKKPRLVNVQEALKRKPAEYNPSISPNLLTHQIYNPKPDETKKSATRSLILLIFGVLAVFLATLLFSYKLSVDIQSITNETLALQDKINDGTNTHNKTKNLIQKVDLHKKLTLNRTRVYKDVGFVLGGFEKGGKLNILTVKEEKTDIQLNVNQAITASLLISHYLENDLVKEISLNSASLDDEGNFNISISIIFNE